MLNPISTPRPKGKLAIRFQGIIKSGEGSSVAIVSRSCIKLGTVIRLHRAQSHNSRAEFLFIDVQALLRALCFFRIARDRSETPARFQGMYFPFEAPLAD